MSFINTCTVKTAFQDTDTDILARILADSPDTPTSSQGCRHIGRVGEDPREDVGVDVDVGVVECGLKAQTPLGRYVIDVLYMASVTKFIAQNNKTTTSASKTTCHFGEFTFTSFMYRFTK